MELVFEDPLRIIIRDSFGYPHAYDLRPTRVSVANLRPIRQDIDRSAADAAFHPRFSLTDHRPTRKRVYPPERPVTATLLRAAAARRVGIRHTHG